MLPSYYIRQRDSTDFILILIIQIAYLLVVKIIFKKVHLSHIITHITCVIGCSRQRTIENQSFFLMSVLFALAGKTASEVKEVDQVMYHDWRLIPKHMEQQFRDFEPLPEPPVRYVPYPPLLRAMILAQHKKTYGAAMAKEPLLPLQRDVLLNKDYFQKQERERQRAEGTPV